MLGTGGISSNTTAQFYLFQRSGFSLWTRYAISILLDNALESPSLHVVLNDFENVGR